jgi:lipopolysaccharide export system permease protein
MTLIGKYLGREIALSVVFVLLGFLALFSFFDLINELDDIGRNGYRLQHALGYVALSLPARVYEIMPIAVLIGAIYALAQFAQHSEFTAMRAAGLGRMMALRQIAGVGLIFLGFTLLVGEWVAPATDRLAQSMKLRSGASVGAALTQFRSGVWLKDSTRDREGNVTVQRFINVGRMFPDTSLSDLRIFEFDAKFRLKLQMQAKTARFSAENGWTLSQVVTTRFSDVALPAAEGVAAGHVMASKREWQETVQWGSEITPGIVGLLAVQPEKMSAYALFNYIRHLKDNKQATSRYEIAMWKKLLYPFAIFVMLALALPFAYLQVRAGSLGYKVFIGIMIGVAFHFLNGLMSHLGLLNTWPAWVSATIPSILAFLLALSMLAWVDRVR